MLLVEAMWVSIKVVFQACPSFECAGGEYSAIQDSVIPGNVNLHDTLVGDQLFLTG